MIKIGEVIKKLRKDRNLTQEELAEYLNISSQAVSKWESGTALPDIATIPAIANFFNVSTDILFSMDDNARNSEVNNVLEVYQELYKQGNLNDAEKVLRDALARYPNNYQLLVKLCNMLFWNNKNNDIQKIDELIQKCELILNNCMDDDIRTTALRLLALAYSGAGKYEKAIETANRLPSRITKEIVLASVLKGEEKTKQRQENILFYLDQIFLELLYMAKEQDDPQTAIVYNSLSIKMLDIFFENKEYYLFHTRLQFAYIAMARRYVDLQEYSKAIESLRVAAEHVIESDKLNGDEKYTSKCFNLCKLKKGGKPFNGTSANQMTEQLKGKKFDPIRDTPEFQEILEKLNQ